MAADSWLTCGLWERGVKREETRELWQCALFPLAFGGCRAAGGCDLLLMWRLIDEGLTL